MKSLGNYNLFVTGTLSILPPFQLRKPMTFQELSLPGAFRITFEKHTDERGSFVRTFCKKTFLEHNLHDDFKQDSLSFNIKKGTLRGLHYQDPEPEVKLVQCLQGEIYDVLVDMRKNSPTFGNWESILLKEGDLTALYIPQGIAHGFQTLKSNTLLHYKISEYYNPAAAQGIRWNDPMIAIEWPTKMNIIISERDASLPLFLTKKDTYAV